MNLSENYYTFGFLLQVNDILIQLKFHKMIYFLQV